MPLHHVNASDAENFDALGVVITGMNFSGDEDQSRRNEDTAPKCIRSAANERGENNIMSERSHIESPHEHSASFNASYSSSNDINIRDSRYSFSSIGSSSHNYGRGNTHTSQRQEPIYEDADQNSGLHSDIHASSKQNTAGKQQKHTTEEDETQSISTIDDSYSVTGQQQSQYYASRSNNLQQSNRFRQSRQRSDADNSSVTSSSACRSQENLYSSQLETRVTKLSLELATTKALLDHAQLEHRRIKEEKDELKLALSALESENEQLHLLVEKLEKEKLLATMEKTVGVAHSVDQLRSSFVSAIEGRRKEDKNFQVTTFRAEPRGAIKHKVRRSRSRSGGELEVPFSNRNNTSKDLKNSFQRSFSDDSLEMSMGALSLHSISDPDLIADEIQKEEYSEDDPFSTWSAPEDRPKEYGRQNIWFGKVPNNPHRHDDDDNNDMSGDPFDTCSKSADSMQQALSDNSSQQTSQQEQRGRGFPLFRGLRGNRGHR
eukprot:scaffold388580_cov86-Cyclotella_meneghiniana.AAC.1